MTRYFDIERANNKSLVKWSRVVVNINDSMFIMELWTASKKIEYIDFVEILNQNV